MCISTLRLCAVRGFSGSLHARLSVKPLQVLQTGSVSLRRRDRSVVNPDRKCPKAKASRLGGYLGQALRIVGCPGELLSHHLLDFGCVLGDVDVHGFDPFESNAQPPVGHLGVEFGQRLQHTKQAQLEGAQERRTSK